MNKKILKLTVIGGVLLGMVLLVNMNAAAYKIDDDPKGKIVTDLSDRSLIKEVLLNQKQMMSMLRDIKGACAVKK